MSLKFKQANNYFTWILSYLKKSCAGGARQGHFAPMFASGKNACLWGIYTASAEGVCGVKYCNYVVIILNVEWWIPMMKHRWKTKYMTTWSQLLNPLPQFTKNRCHGLHSTREQWRTQQKFESVDDHKVIWSKCFKGAKERMRICELLFRSHTLLRLWGGSIVDL